MRQLEGKRMLSTREIVSELDRYIIGQSAAKRAVAIALRNRYRRSRLSTELQEEITPKNIIMMGPTGVGKTEIARRLAKLVSAPFIKVEATKFTEVGYVGRDVESIVRDLVEVAIRLVKAERRAAVAGEAEKSAERRLAKLLSKDKDIRPQQRTPIEMLFGQNKQPPPSPEERERLEQRETSVRELLEKGALEDKYIEIEVEDEPPMMELVPGSGSINIGDMLGGILPKRTKIRRVTVAEARRILASEEADKLIDMDEVQLEAVRRTEQDGIVFLDEIDKIAGGGRQSGPDVSREGVQRDILPIVEGSTVATKYGPVKTDFILFIAAGAFHVSKVGDLIPELQGRFPIHVELSSLKKEDFQLILTQPDNALTKQYKALLETDGVSLEFTEDAIERIAHFAYLGNSDSENIGARRLHAVLEQVLEDIAFHAGSDESVEIPVNVDGAYVEARMREQMRARDISKYIL